MKQIKIAAIAALGMMTLPLCGAFAADFNVKDYGGSVPEAAEAAAAAGGGRIVVPAGVWKSGTIWLKSHCELHLEKGAVILGSTDEKDYNKNESVSQGCDGGGSGGDLEKVPRTRSGGDRL